MNEKYGGWSDCLAPEEGRSGKECLGGRYEAIMSWSLCNQISIGACGGR